MRRQTSLLILGWALALGWLALIHQTAPTDAELWDQFQRSKDPKDFSILILRGAFGTDGRPKLSEWLRENDTEDELWTARVFARHPLEVKGMREEAAARR